MEVDTRTAALQERAVKKLVDAHMTGRDERLVLAVRFGHDDLDVSVLEVLDGWPGTDDDKLYPMEFASTSDLLAPGKIRLLLGSPTQVRNALRRGDEALLPVRADGIVVVRTAEADDIIATLGARLALTNGERAARNEYVASLDEDQRASPQEKDALLRSWRP